MPLLDPSRSYTFSEIGKLKAPTDELLAEYGYALERTLVNLPQYQGELDRLQERRDRIEEYRVPTDLAPLMRILVAALL